MKTFSTEYPSYPNRRKCSSLRRIYEKEVHYFAHGNAFYDVYILYKVKPISVIMT